MLTIKDFLDSHQVKYTVINYSLAYSIEEVQDQQAMLGMELVETVLLEINSCQVVMAVFPKSMMIDMAMLQKKLGVKTIRILPPDEIQKRFSNYSSDIVVPLGKFYELEVFLAGELEKNREIKFLSDSPRSLLSMTYADLVQLSETREDIRIPTKSKYRVLVDKVSPESERHKIEDYDSCFLGISLENPSFSTAKLIAMTDWIAKRFKSCRVLMGDSLHRLTLQIDRGLGERQALTQTLFMGKEYINTELAVFDRHLDTCSFEFIYCSDIQQSDNYQKYYNIFQDLLQHNAKLAASVNSFSLKFVRRHLELDEENISSNAFLDICHKYLLEELAIFACLFETYSCPILYPGSLSIFEEITNGEHPDVPDFLIKIIWVCLRFRGR
jgi:tRNA-dependent cyclodipeptide synthase